MVVHSSRDPCLPDTHGCCFILPASKLFNVLKNLRVLSCFPVRLYRPYTHRSVLFSSPCTHNLGLHQQPRIQDFRGTPNRNGVSQPIFLPKFGETEWKWRKLEWEEARTSKIVLCRSATDQSLQISSSTLGYCLALPCDPAAPDIHMYYFIPFTSIIYPDHSVQSAQVPQLFGFPLQSCCPWQFFLPLVPLICGYQHWRIQGGQGHAPPTPGSPNSFIFVQFSAKNVQNNRLAPTWRPLLRKILDPPLISLFKSVQVPSGVVVFSRASPVSLSGQRKETSSWPWP